MHMLHWLSTTGTAAIVEFPGVLYRGGAEGKIRKYLVDNNYVDTVIQLPDNLFFGVTIAVCIIVLKKNKSEAKTFFIDASNEFVHEGNKNKLSPDNIRRVHDAFVSKADQPHFTRLVPNTEIADNGYNLSVSSYVEQEDKREIIDIEELNLRIAGIVKRENELRHAIDEIIKAL
jgi:type I restriction enzyme M protein